MFQILSSSLPQIQLFQKDIWPELYKMAWNHLLIYYSLTLPFKMTYKNNTAR